MTTPTKTFWEDLEIGRVLETGSLTLNAPDIKSFAEKYDPQPYHLDRDAAEASLFGGLCASGWHMTALMMKLISDQLDAEQIPLVGTGEVAWLEWYRPAFEGDSLSARVTVTEKTMPQDETDHGLVGCDIEVHNQDRKKVMALSTDLMIGNKGRAHG
jgi:acyl dehydratase